MTDYRVYGQSRSGSVCLDVINQTWSPMYDMINIFEAFLPHLLRYPNPSDPLNGEAAALMLRDPKSYDAKVRGMLNSALHTCIDLFLGCIHSHIYQQSMSSATRVKTRPRRRALRVRTTTI